MKHLKPLDLGCNISSMNRVEYSPKPIEICAKFNKFNMVNSSRVREENPLLGDTGEIGILQFKNSPKASMNGRYLRWLFCGMTTKSDVASFESKQTQSGHQTALESQKKAVDSDEEWGDTATRTYWRMPTITCRTNRSGLMEGMMLRGGEGGRESKTTRQCQNLP